jgi:hypothetical protein
VLFRSVGEFLAANPHLALVAKPGGGKSTLLKRLAIAYAIPKRRADLDDQLPEREWLPLFLRCRELRDRVQRPIMELLDDLPRHAGLADDEAVLFRERVHDALRSGQALLLIDGLDEISEEGARQMFAQHLRTLIGMFPQAGVVVTSREAGFRFVAGVVASVCAYARLAPFDRDDVRRLCEAWHAEVVANTEKVRAEAGELAEKIWNNERIRALAENPLMLTTLLVVRRWVGELPTKRVELYREAVRVLIRTWNTEGFTPMDLEEALAQLSYVACAMMEAGQQQIGYKPLLKLLNQARRELSVELQFTRISAAEFIERIEYRSSLLMQTGYAPVDGEVQPVYEFRHLTFQEYLAARGFVDEQYPGRDDGRTLTELLEPHFDEETWREVIPLAVVLAGRKAEPVIARLAEICEKIAVDTHGLRKNTTEPAVVLLRRCLADEVQLTAGTLERALREAGRLGSEEVVSHSVISNIASGKFGALFRKVIERTFFGAAERWEEFYAAADELARMSYFPNAEPQLTALEEDTLLEGLRSASVVTQGFAAFAAVQWAYQHFRRQSRTSVPGAGAGVRDSIAEILSTDNYPIALCASWALVWLGAARLPSHPPKPRVMFTLYELWHQRELSQLARFAAWAFATQPLIADTLELPPFLESPEEKHGSVYYEARLVEMWYRRQIYADDQL